MPALVRCNGRLVDDQQCDEMIEPHHDFCVWCEDVNPDRARRDIEISPDQG